MDLHDEESGAEGVSESMGRLALARTCSRVAMVGELKRTRSTASLPLETQNVNGRDALPRVRQNYACTTAAGWVTGE